MDKHNCQSPIINNLAWGKMSIDGLGSGKDYKLWPGGGRDWDWTETGTHHVPGIQPEDVEELLANGARVVVLSQGQMQRLKTCPQTLAVLKARGIDVHMTETRQAVKLYNRLARQGEAVGGLFHSTC